MEGHRLYTWFWKAALADDVSDELVLVRTSLGAPRQLPRELRDELATVRELMPYGLMKVEPWAEFERLYVERLNRFGPQLLDEQFVSISEANGGLPLALLCFEHHPSRCHRGVFARWWLEQTGEQVPEWTGSPAAPSAPPPEPAQGSLL